MVHAARHARPVRRSRRLSVLGVLLVATLGAVGWLLLTSGDAGVPRPAVAAAAPAAAAPAALLPTGPGPVTDDEQARCGLDTGACADLAEHKAWLVRGREVSYGPVPMMPGSNTGKRPPGPGSNATPTGDFFVQRKQADAVSAENGEPMPHAVYFAPGGIAFHEGSLTQGSLGCIHLSPDAAQAFYDRLGVGQRVTVF